MAGRKEYSENMEMESEKLMCFFFMNISEPRVVRVQEGDTANFTVLRNGSVDITCTVQYATVDAKASAKEGDFVPAAKGETIVFEVGSTEQSLSVYINEDGIPETEEHFYIMLFNSTGKEILLLW
jgi:G-protein coupled receptor 98